MDVGRDVVLKRRCGKAETAPNSSNKVSIRLQEFPHWIFLFHWKHLDFSLETYRLLTNSANLRSTFAHTKLSANLSKDIEHQQKFNKVF